MKQVTKNILYEKVGGIQDFKANGGVKSKETMLNNVKIKQVTKKKLYEKVDGKQDFKTMQQWCKNKETKSYQKGKCNNPIFSTFLGHMLFVC